MKVNLRFLHVLSLDIVYSWFELAKFEPRHGWQKMSICLSSCETGKLPINPNPTCMIKMTNLSRIRISETLHNLITETSRIKFEISFPWTRNQMKALLRSWFIPTISSCMSTINCGKRLSRFLVLRVLLSCVEIFKLSEIFLQILKCHVTSNLRK